MKASLKNHPLMIMIGDLKTITSEEIEFKNKYEGDFKEEDLSKVLGALVWHYGEWAERVEAIETRLTNFTPSSPRERKTWGEIAEFITRVKGNYIKTRDHFSAHPRTFRTSEKE